MTGVLTSSRPGLIMPDRPGLLTPEQFGKSTLKEYEFTDIFFNENAQAFMRGLEQDDDDDDNISPLSPIPEACIGDAVRLHRQIMEQGASKDEFFSDYDGMRFRVSKITTVGSVWFTLRRALWPIPRIKQLKGLHPRVLEALGRIASPGGTNASPGKGLILVCGETGSGKTTLACTLLQEYLLHYGDIAVTVEDPIELSLDGPYRNGRGYCFQTQVREGDFRNALKMTMRRSPRYILLGEVRGYDEASEALRAGINGHVVLTTIHAGSAIEGLNAMVKFVAGREPVELARSILADGIAAVIHISLHRVPKRDGGGKAFKVESLFFGPGDKSAASRSAIRRGATEQLVQPIERQANLIRLNRPIDFT
ncbi:hypothetical protein AD929_04315 [Gluconobacter potus]|uniref:Bacterial type II secretion system protein E domain-containing protein n=2 Tax=Gluconobacter potus TaxID=2724927 RepID=A0A149QY16_9PROT|nr:hypothetical protein AD929_04315 [Gluconobacter potus]